MHIRNKRSYALEHPVTFEPVEPGKSIKVDDDLGKSLVLQPANWERVDSPKKAGTAGKEG